MAGRLLAAKPLLSPPLQWRHNERDGVSNHRRLDCLFNHLFRRRSKKTSKLRVSGLCRGNRRWSVVSPHKGPLVTRKMFPFGDVIMIDDFVSIGHLRTNSLKYSSTHHVCQWRSLTLHVSFCQFRGYAPTVLLTVTQNLAYSFIMQIYMWYISFVANSFHLNHAPAFYRARWLAKVTRRV